MSTATANTGLTVIESSRFMALDPNNAQMVALKENLAASGESLTPSDLVRVKTPAGGGTNWEVPNALGAPELTPALSGIMVLYKTAGVLWPTDDAKEGTMPVLRTFDLQTAEQVGPIPDDMIDVLERFRIDDRHFNWKDLPYNQFGTGKNGQGKRCKEQRMMFLLRENDPFPLMLTAQPGSLKPVTGFIKKLAFQVPYYRAIVELKLEKKVSKSGQAFSQIVPALRGVLSTEDGARVKREYTDVLERMVSKLDLTPESDGSGDE